VAVTVRFSLAVLVLFGTVRITQARTMDRAATPSAQVQLPPERENDVVLNVLNDIELWYSGSVENYGWMISTEEPNEEVLFFAYPLSYPGSWKLNITYGP